MCSCTGTDDDLCNQLYVQVSLSFMFPCLPCKASMTGGKTDWQLTIFLHGYEDKAEKLIADLHSTEVDESFRPLGKLE